MAIRLIIAGLRRSGTTIFWESFLQDPQLACYDEPFNPLLESLPQTAGIKHPDAFLDLMGKDEARFRRLLRPIRRNEELESTVDEGLERYIEFLAESGESVVLDTTRCHFRLERLAEIAPKAVLLHLYRKPACNATSHLLPSGGHQMLDRMRSAWRRKTFFTRRGHYNNWGFQDLVEGVGESRFREYLAATGIDADPYYRMPAVGKLLGLWRVAWEQVENEGRRLFDGRFVSIDFDRFCIEPEATIAEVYRAMGLPMPAMQFGAVRAPKPPFDAASPHWGRFERELRLPPVGS